MNGFDGTFGSVMLSWEWAVHLISQGKGYLRALQGLVVGHI